MKTFSKIMLIMVQTLAFTLSCTSDGDDAPPASQISSSSSSSDAFSSSSSEVAISLCGSVEYDSLNAKLRCNEGVLETRCGITEPEWYNSATDFCQGSIDGWRVAPLCGNRGYTSGEFCQDSAMVVRVLCGGLTYTIFQFCCDNAVGNNATQFCCNGAMGNNATHSCQHNTMIAKPSPATPSKAVPMCGDEPYDPATHFCHSDDIVYNKCGGDDYDPETQFCQSETNEVTLFCNGQPYEHSEFCSSNTVYSKCGGTESYSPPTEECCASKKFAKSSEFCQNDTDEVLPLCDGQPYEHSEFCSSNTVYSKCGGTESYSPPDEECCDSQKYSKRHQFCYEGSKRGDFCDYEWDMVDEGKRNKHIYDPERFGCSSKNSKGIYSKEKMTLGGRVYDAVLVGDQVWIDSEVNYPIDGSVCYQGDCDTYSEYGRWYTWEMAQDVCPDGWHLPSSEEWLALEELEDSYQPPYWNTGTYLMWVSEEDKHPDYIEYEDAYGFAAHESETCYVFDEDKDEFLWGYCGGDRLSLWSSSKYYNLTISNYRVIISNSAPPTYYYLVRCVLGR